MANDANALWRATGIPHWQADCARCSREISDRMVAAGEMKWYEAASQPMWVCPLCGSKRCAKASDHEYACDEGAAEVTMRKAREESDRAEIERRGITRQELMKERIAAFLAGAENDG
jgi:DNA-directed RNA polymerase subunit RPC12/RpoP